MNKSPRILILVTAMTLLISATACDKLRARDQLNKGVQSYKSARYEEAINHFQRSVALDPGLLNARLYLATAYAQQYIPGVDSEENNHMAEQAIAQFKRVVDVRPSRDQQISSLKGIASLYLNMHKLDLAKEYQKRVTAIDPNDPEAYYSIGVVDWTPVYQPDMEERGKLGLRADDPVNDKKVCGALRARNTELIEDRLNNLNKCLQLRPDYDDAMAYVNLLYRQKADTECDPAASMADLKTAQDWVDKTMAAKKAKAEKQPGAAGITLDQRQPINSITTHL
jgi:tetratricopeptide (TPR) repeat protein